MSVICSRCRGVFYSNAEYVNHRCGVELVPRDASKGKQEAQSAKPTQDVQAAPQSTKGLHIQDRLAKVLPIGDFGSGGDDTPLVHDTQSQFQNAMMFLAKNTTADGNTKIMPHDVRAIVRGVHLLCDRIEELHGGGVKP